MRRQVRLAGALTVHRFSPRFPAMKRFTPALLAMALSQLSTTQAAPAEIQTSPFVYQIEGQPYEGSISRPARLTGAAPGILVASDWKGYGPFAKERAEDLARLGYIAFAIDMYGQGVHAADTAEATKLSAPFYQDFTLFRTRAQAALAELRKQPGVDANRIGAMGFCFGGTTVLELARSGAPVEGVVTFHGGLATGLPARPGAIKARELLILAGSLDPLVPPADVAGFMIEMNGVHVPYRLVEYPNTVHAFTNPAAGNDLTKPTAYNAASAEAAYAEMRAFFQRLFQN
jgi:dienelactone hydrolase